MTTQDITSTPIESEPLRWRHIQAIVRLIQTVQLLADVIIDWDTIVDTFGQLLVLMSTKISAPPEDLVLLDIEKIYHSLDRFKTYSIFLSNDALVKLMTSLVALSLNGLEDIPKSSKLNQYAYSHPNTINDSKGLSFSPAYICEASSFGIISFPLRLVIEVTKLNSYRVFCIWYISLILVFVIFLHACNIFLIESLFYIIFLFIVTSTLVTGKW